MTALKHLIVAIGLIAVWLLVMKAFPFYLSFTLEELPWLFGYIISTLLIAAALLLFGILITAFFVWLPFQAIYYFVCGVKK